MKRYIVTCLVLFSAFAQAQPTPVNWSLAGPWRVHDANQAGFDGLREEDKNWRTLRVPANWYSAGYDHQGAMWYRRDFAMPALAPETMATLVFDGVDYFADVSLNGKHLTRHEGYFQRFAVDITDAVHRHNRLAVRVDSPWEDPKTIWPLHKGLVKGVLNQHDTRPGDAWSERGQDANSGGIWSPVRLHLSRGAVIDEIILRPDWQNGLDKPALRAEIRYRAKKAASATLKLVATPDNFSGQAFHLAQAVTLNATNGKTDKLTLTLPMEGAKLWWPAGLGKPNLYRVSASLTDKQGVMDRAKSRTGLRKVEEQPDNRGWLVNEKRLFIKGTNYIGSPWLSIMTKEKYRRDLQMVLGMNANAIRVHGHVANRPLYQVADELGLMIWQDVPLQWGYDNSAAFADNAARQTREMVEQFGNSPAIIVWGGHNEPPWNSPWMEKRFPDWNKDLNRALTEKIADTLAEDNSRIVHRFSSVEEHYWQGWYFGVMRDLLAPAKTAIITEFGAQALPRLATLKTFIPPSVLWPATTKADDPGWERWKYHNFQPFQTFVFAKIPRGNNIDAFIHNTQQYQAELVAMAAESYRRQRYQPVTALFQFMFVETWPSINWGVVDYLRHPKPGYYALQRAYQPLLPSIEPVSAEWQSGKPATLRLWTVNDTYQDCSDCSLKWQVSLGDLQLVVGDKQQTLAADSVATISDVTVTPRTTGTLKVNYQIYDAKGKKVAENGWQTEVQPATN
ncbi:glycoside hydrolase family 2 [Enterobacter sp. Bisph1]|uniref:glycoside hydrolase family 2 protein n=1 Tax=Enterobacter sp. Bisph1 TaxID=1274399 RepID=UPI00057BF562|nr:glycoside hydrolase family 2 [Enterobacter sp. Bisph1]